MKKIIILIVLLSIILPNRVLAVETSSDIVTLSNCVDGTSARFMLGLKEVKVKFLGIDVEDNLKNEDITESSELSTSDYVCDMLTNAKTIRIEYEPNIEKEDKYGRIQAWVFIDEELLQDNLVKNGYAKLMYLNDEFLYAESLKESQSYARKNKLGIWEDDIVEVETVKNENDDSEEKKSKGFFETIFDFIGGLFEKFLKFIDDIISNIL